MAKNDVNFRIRITDEASGGLKRISMSSKDLSNTINRVTDEANKAQRSIINWAQTAQAADMLGQSINNLYNWSKDVTQAYQVQLVRRRNSLPS